MYWFGDSDRAKYGQLSQLIATHIIVNQRSSAMTNSRIAMYEIKQYLNRDRYERTEQRRRLRSENSARLIF